jgi:dTDP-glucose 4,6-dehydratase
MQLLVTGGAGFIGSNFIHGWLARHPGDVLVNLDSLTYAGNLENLTDIANLPNYRFIHGSICDSETVRNAVDGCEVVVHFAAESFVDRSIVGAQVFIETNVLGTQILFDAARDAGVKRFIYVSTDEVYGSLGPTGVFTEKSPLEPNNPYSASKASGDLLARSYFKTFGFPVITTHCSNNYGPYQFPEKFIPLFMIRAMQDKPLPLYGDGGNVRDWIHVSDHCRGIELVIEKGCEGEVYNFGGECERSNVAIAREICRLTGKPESLIQFVKDRPGHDRRYAVSNDKVNAELGFEPSGPIEARLPELLDWYRAQEPWWQRILSGEYKNFYQKWYGDERGA